MAVLIAAPRHHRAQRRHPDDPARVRHHPAERCSGSSPATASRSPRCSSSAAGSATSSAPAACSSSAPRSSASARSSRRSRPASSCLVIGEAIIEGIGASLMLPATHGHPLEHVPRPRAGHRVRGLGRGHGRRGRVRAAARRVPHHQLLVALGVPHQRDRRAVRHRRRAAVHAPQPPRRAGASASTCPARCSSPRACSCSCSASARARTYGWWTPLQGVRRSLGVDLWPASDADLDRAGRVPARRRAALRVLPGAASQGARRHATRCSSSATSRGPAFRYGIVTLLLLAMGQVAFLLVHVGACCRTAGTSRAVDTGLWLVPSGRRSSSSASQIGSWLTRRIGTTNVVRAGLLLEAVGLARHGARRSRPTSRSWRCCPGFALFGIGIGFAGSQLNNVILSDVPPERSGAASGANSTVRMIGAVARHRDHRARCSASQTIRHAVETLTGAADLPARRPASARRPDPRQRGEASRPSPGCRPRSRPPSARRSSTPWSRAARRRCSSPPASCSWRSALSMLIPQIGGGRDAAVDEEDPAELARRTSEALGESVAVQ